MKELGQYANITLSVMAPTDLFPLTIDDDDLAEDEYLEWLEKLVVFIKSTTPNNWEINIYGG
jgi:hypothetical protein